MKDHTAHHHSLFTLILCSAERQEMAAMKARVGDLERDLMMEKRRVEEAQVQLSESIGRQAELLAAKEELVQMMDQCRKAEEKTRQVERESKVQLNGEMYDHHTPR